MARKVRIELILDADGVVQGFGRIDDEIKGVKKSLTASEKALKGFKKFVAGAFLVAAARGVARFTARMFELGSSVEETGSKFNTVFGEMAGSMDDFGESFANMAGLTKREFQDIASVTASILQGLGADLATSAAETQRVLTLAADLASFNNVSIQEAFAAIRSGLIGESEPLKRFGIVLTEAETKLRALNTTGKQSEKQLTNLEKAQARLTIIFANAGVAIGDLERTQSSAANESKRFNAVMREQEELLATALLPALNDVRRAFSEIVVEEKKAVQDTITFLGRLASIIVKMFGTSLGALSDFFSAANLKFQLSLAQTERLVGGALRRIAAVANVVNNSLTAIGIGPVDAINRLAASAQNAAGFLDDVAQERIRAALENIGITSEKAAGGVDQLTQSLGGTPTGTAGGGGGAGGGAGAKKGLKGVVETLNEEIRKLAVQVRDLTQADEAEVVALLRKVDALEQELFFRQQLLQFRALPTEAPIRPLAPAGGPEEPISLEEDLTRFSKRVAAENEITEALQAQEEAERALQQASIERAVAIGAAQADVLQSILATVRQIIQARLAEAIAGAVAAGSILGPIAAAVSGALMAILFNQLMPSGHKGSSGGGGAGARADTTSTTGVALGGIRVQRRGVTAGAQGAALGARAPLDLRIEVIEKDLFTINVLLKNADGVRDQVGSI